MRADSGYFGTCGKTPLDARARMSMKTSVAGCRPGETRRSLGNPSLSLSYWARSAPLLDSGPYRMAKLRRSFRIS